MSQLDILCLSSFHCWAFATLLLLLLSCSEMQFYFIVDVVAVLSVAERIYFRVKMSRSQGTKYSAGVSFCTIVRHSYPRRSMSSFTWGTRNTVLGRGETEEV